MRSGRMRRLAGGLGLGYLQTFAAVLAGLAVTPYLLRQLGSHDYGLWLLGTQVVFYLALMDLGVVALVPREVARVSGLPEADRTPALQKLIGETVRLVLWQLPPVALAGLLVFWLLPSEWEPLRWPLGIVVLAFVAAFPFRISLAVLQGLQDLAFAGTVQLVSWAVGLLATLVGVVLGLELYSLAIGWVITQTLSALMSWMRLARSFPDVLPRQVPSLTAEVLRQQLGRGVWISVAQVARVLLSGTDLMVIGKLLGPAAVVPYACTGKLVTLLANQPQMFMQLALPALSELRTSAPRQRLSEVSRSMAQVMLLGSGAIVTVVLAVNHAFVPWWVGSAQFAGTGLTALLLAGMLLRHLNATAVYALYCFGNERRLALTTMAEGLVGLGALCLLVPKLGLYGGAVGPLLATLLVALPNNFWALAREEQTSPLALLSPLGNWLVRLAALLALATAVSTWALRGLSGLAIGAAAVGIAYVVFMIPVLRKPPLGPMLSAALHPWLIGVSGRLKRLASQPLGLLQ